MTKVSVKLDDATQTISLGDAGEIAVDVAKMFDHEAVIQYVFNYGLKQMLNDVHAGETAKKTPDEKTRNANKLALATKKLNSLLAGEVAQARLGGDPIARLVRDMALDAVKADIRKAGKKFSDFKKENIAKGVEAKIAKFGEEYRKAAEKIVKMKPVVADDDSDDIMALLG